MDLARDLERGAVRVHVLHHAAERPVTGAWMATELRRHGYRISPGTLYPALHALEAEGLLSSSEGVEAGRAVRRYSVTPTGRRALGDARRTLAELAGELLGGPDVAPSDGGEEGVDPVEQLAVAADALRALAAGSQDRRAGGVLTAAASVVDGVARMIADVGPGTADG